jgi:hypothetical protein
MHDGGATGEGAEAREKPGPTPAPAVRSLAFHRGAAAGKPLTSAVNPGGAN